ncbi:ferredoxin [Mycobacterium sp. 23]|uniref:ferredoxin n=1 Tax=Mycobacterium sp. 23 TaxID=3400424 RepID=UPI003AAE692D
MTGRVRADNRLADMPMSPVDCRRCGAQVSVRKSSWNQTSVQWNARASASCLERARALADQHRGLFLACSALRDSIEAAVAAGTVAVFDTG